MKGWGLKQTFKIKLDNAKAFNLKRKMLLELICKSDDALKGLEQSNELNGALSLLATALLKLLKVT